MRHRASRPFLDLWRRLPRAAARPLDAIARMRPLRVAGALAVMLGVGTTAVVGVSAVHDGPSGQQARQSALGERPGTSGASRGTSRPDLDDASPATGEDAQSSSAPSPTRSPEQDRSPGRTSDAPDTDLPKADTTSPLPSPPTDDTATPGSTSGSGGATSSSTPQDTDPPQTSVSDRYPAGDVAVFTFGADEPASFACSLDGAAFSACTSAATYSDLSPGWHTFAVRAVDRAGNADPTPARVRWHANGGQDATGE